MDTSSTLRVSWMLVSIVLALVIFVIPPAASWGDCQSAYLFQCPDLECIDILRWCDGFPDCSDGGDEEGCHLLRLIREAGDKDAPSDGESLDDSKDKDGDVTTVAVFPTTDFEILPTASILDESVYLWMPLIVVLIFTIVMITLVVVGRRGANSDSANLTNQGVGFNLLDMFWGRKTLTIATTSAELPTTVTPDSSSVEISFFVIGGLMAIILVICLSLGCREQKRERGRYTAASGSGSEGTSPVSMETTVGFDPSGGTPPPRYSFLERHFSFLSVGSRSSQASSAIEVPPGYDEAIDLPGAGGVSRTRSRSGRRSSSGSGRRNRRPWLFSRSASSAGDSRYNRNGSDSRPRYQRPLSESSAIPEPVSILRISNLSDTSDVFIELSPQNHLNPSIISEEELSDISVTHNNNNIVPSSTPVSINEHMTNLEHSDTGQTVIPMPDISPVAQPGGEMNNSDVPLVPESTNGDSSTSSHDNTVDHLINDSVSSEGQNRSNDDHTSTML